MEQFLLKKLEEKNRASSQDFLKTGEACILVNVAWNSSDSAGKGETKLDSPVLDSPIPQIDGNRDIFEREQKVKYTFNSEYAEEDIKEALEEIFSDKNSVKSATLVSRVREATWSAVHNCVIELCIAAPDTFVWPELKGVDIDVFKGIKKTRK